MRLACVTDGLARPFTGVAIEAAVPTSAAMIVLSVRRAPRWSRAMPYAHVGPSLAARTGTLVWLVALAPWLQLA